MSQIVKHTKGRDKYYLVAIAMLVVALSVSIVALSHHKTNTTKSKTANITNNSVPQSVSSPNTTITQPYISSTDHFQINFPGTPLIKYNNGGQATILTIGYLLTTRVLM